MSLNGIATLSAFSIYNQRKRKRQPVKSTPSLKSKHPDKKAKNDKLPKENKRKDDEGIPIKKLKSGKGVQKESKDSGKPQKTKRKLTAKKIKKSDDIPPLLVPIDRESRIVSSQNNLHSLPPQLSPIIGNIMKSGHLPQCISNIDPSTGGLRLFKWLIAPIKPSVFFEKYWETSSLYINRSNSDYYKNMFTTKRFNEILREFPLYYTRNVDVVSYENGIKEVHNEEGRVYPAGLYDYYVNGCSIRVLNPQTYDRKVYILISTLQEYFGSMVGTNVYLTPPGSQGFAPHFDDIEAFIIQLEGRKHWKLYKPQKNDLLARDSSPNLKAEDIGKPFMEVTLNAGDLLYFPRGTIHEGRTDKDMHSLHITVSVYQHNSYADLLELVLPQAIKKAATENLEFRRGLPLNYLKHLGYVNKGTYSDQRQSILKQVKNLIQKLPEYSDLDAAADQMGRKFMYDSMPPSVSKNEALCTSKFDGDQMENGKVYNRVEIELETEVRLIRYHCLRVVQEGEIRIYYNTDNARVYHGEEEQFLGIDLDLVPCLKSLQNAYPNFVTIENLPCEDPIKKVQLVYDLWEKGLIVTNGPLNLCSDDEDNEGSSED